MKKLKQLKSHNVLDQNDLKNIFLENAPERYNREALDVLFHRTINDHIDSTEALFLTRVNDFKKNINKGKKSWLSLFAEIHSRYMLAESIKKNGGKVLFSKKDENDLHIQKNKGNVSVEVKAIMPSDFQLDYDNFLKEVRNIPSGKIVSIRVKNSNNDRNEIFNNIKNKLQNLNDDYSNDDFEIKFINDSRDQNKTAFIGPPLCLWIKQEDLIKVIKQKLRDKPKQIKKANIIFFYSFHNMFDSEDFCEAIKTISTELQTIDNKKILFFTPWNRGRLIAIIKENEEWIIKNIEDIV